jgi:hypothetical protein
MPGLPVLAGPGFLRAVEPQYARKDVERDRRVGSIEGMGPLRSDAGSGAARCLRGSGLVTGFAAMSVRKNRLIELTPG